MRALAYLMLALIVGGLTHIASILLLPRAMRADAFDVLAAAADPAGGVALVERERVEAMPFADPFMVLGICRYDLAAGPFRVRTRLSESFLAVVLAEEKRGIYFSVSDRAATGGMLDVVLATEAQLERITELDDRNEAVEEIRIPAPRPRGLAIVKVLVDRPSAREGAEALIREVRCESEALPG